MAESLAEALPREQARVRGARGEVRRVAARERREDRRPSEAARGEGLLRAGDARPGQAGERGRGVLVSDGNRELNRRIMQAFRDAEEARLGKLTTESEFIRVSGWLRRIMGAQDLASFLIYPNPGSR